MQRAHRDLMRMFLVSLLVALVPSVASAGNGGGFGAIAYSPSTDQFGTSSGMDSLGDARDAAMMQCNAGDCTLVAWEQHGVAVLATGLDQAYAAATDPRNWSLAAGNAQNACNAHSTNCVLRTWVSS